MHGIVKTTRNIEVLLFQTVLIYGLSHGKGHNKRINVIKDAPEKSFNPIDFSPEQNMLVVLRQAVILY